MTSMPRLNRPVRAARRQPVRADRRSTCKRCRCGIFSDQPAVWQVRPLIGLVHQQCAEERGDDK